MNTDYRIKIGFFRHHKTRKLEQRLGEAGVIALIRLWEYAAEFRPDGSLSGMNEEDIALAAGWRGDGNLVSTLIEIGWLDEEPGCLSLHDWLEHNPWAADAEERSDKGRLSRLFRKNPEAADEFRKQGRTGITAEEYHNATSVRPYNDRSTSLQRPYNDRSTTVVRTAVAPTPTPTPVPVYNTTTTPNPSSSSSNDRDVVSGGDGETESRDVVVLEYPPTLTPYEHQQAETLVQAVPEHAQELLDELAAAIQAKKVKTSPVAYLRGLAKRAAAGTFAAEAGQRIAKERERRRRAMAAVAAAATRPPDAQERRARRAPIDVGARIAELRAAMAGERKDIAA